MKKTLFPLILADWYSVSYIHKNYKKLGNDKKYTLSSDCSKIGTSSYIIHFFAFQIRNKEILKTF